MKRLIAVILLVSSGVAYSQVPTTSPDFRPNLRTDYVKSSTPRLPVIIDDSTRQYFYFEIMGASEPWVPTVNGVRVYYDSTERRLKAKFAWGEERYLDSLAPPSAPSDTSLFAVLSDSSAKVEWANILNTPALGDSVRAANIADSAKVIEYGNVLNPPDSLRASSKADTSAVAGHASTASIASISDSTGKVLYSNVINPPDSLRAVFKSDTSGKADTARIAGLASSVPWSGVTSAPDSFRASSKADSAGKVEYSNVLNAPAVGETNDGVNMGTTGYRPYKDKSGVNIRLRTLYENNANMSFTEGTDSTVFDFSAAPQFDTMKVGTAIPVHRLTVSGQGLFYGSFGAINLWQSTTGLGYRFVLNNDTTFRLQRNTTAFSGGTTTTPMLFDNANNVTFSNNVTATKAFISDTLKPQTATGTVIIRAGDGAIAQSANSAGVALKILNSAGTPVMRFLVDSSRVGIMGGDNKPAVSGSSTGHVTILDPLWVEEDLWADESIIVTGMTRNGSRVNTYSVAASAAGGNTAMKVASTTNIVSDMTLQIEANPAHSKYEVLRVNYVSNDTVYFGDSFQYAHDSGTVVSWYQFKGTIYPVNWNMYEPGGFLRIGAKVTRAEVDSFYAQTIEQGQHTAFASHLAKLFGNTVIDGGTVRAQGTPAMFVDVDSGMALINKTSVDSVPKGYTFEGRTQKNVAIAASDPTNPRVDLVYWDSVGVVRVVTGTPAGSPSTPSLPSAGTSLATVAVAALATTVTSGNITDTRVFNLLHARPASQNNFILTASDKNINTSTAAQAADTSAFAFSFTAAGRPQLRVTSQVGGERFLFDTLGNIFSAGYFVTTGAANSIRLRQTSTGAGHRILLNNDGTLRFQFSPDGGATGTKAWMLADSNQNVGFAGLTSFGSSAVGVLGIKNGTAPGSSPADAVQIYAEDVASSSELKVRDEAGNTTTLSPHNFSGIPEGPSEEMAWAFYSERDGKYVNVDMLKLARLVEKLTGEKLVYTGKK